MKILCIVQARMGSERLPGKVMKKISGIPLIECTLKRLSRSRYIDNIVLATSSNNEDDILASYVESIGFNVYRGSELNVLKRYVESAKEYTSDIIIRVTGDCPYIDPYIVDNVISKFLIEDVDYIRLDVPKTFIRGFDVEVFKAETLFDVQYKVNKLSIKERMPYLEHVTYYIYTHENEYSTSVVEGDNFYSKNYRLCVDTIEDFRLIENIMNHFNNIYVSSKEIVKYLDENKNLLEVNKEIRQKIVNKK